MPILIKLIADAPTKEYLTHAVQLFVFCVKQTPRNAVEMKRRHSYHLLAGILTNKYQLISAELQAMLFDLTLHDDGNGFETSTITNIPAFQHLILDYNVWRKAEPELICCVYLNLRQLVTKSSRRIENVSLLRSLEAVDKLFSLVIDTATNPRLAEICCAIIGSSTRIVLAVYNIIVIPLCSNPSISTLRLVTFIQVTWSEPIRTRPISSNTLISCCLQSTSKLRRTPKRTSI